MKRQWWFRVFKSTILVFGYFWYNASLRSAVVRVLS